MYVSGQPGLIVAISDPGPQKEGKTHSVYEILDIREQVSDRGWEEGLLGLAIDPDAAAYLYLYYSAANPRRSVVSRFSIPGPDSPAAADPDSELVILEVAQPYPNHNGGQLAFGPDGYLYIGLGDGGSAGDPQGNGQDTSTLLAPDNCRQEGMIPPVWEYPLEDDACSVIGGYVYRGAAIPWLNGVYVYGDFCTGQVFGLRREGADFTNHLLADTGLRIASFGQDNDGELYVLSQGEGIFRLEE